MGAALRPAQESVSHIQVSDNPEVTSPKSKPKVNLSKSQPKRPPPTRTRSRRLSTENKARSNITHQTALCFSSPYKMPLGLEASSPRGPTSQGLNESIQKGNTSKRKFSEYQEGIEDTENGSPERKKQTMDHYEESINTFLEKPKVTSSESRPKLSSPTPFQIECPSQV